MSNEIFGWLWIVAGFASGAVMGLFFHRAEWLGGYESYRRRLIRLGHISFFGLGFINLFFAQSIARARLTDFETGASTWAVILGGILMPLCCGLTAWKPALKPLFVLPVTALTYGGVTLVVGLIRSAAT